MSTMSTQRSLPATMTEEVSGWWPSERSAKSRFKALLSRTKLEKLTRQNRVESTPIQPNILQSMHSGREAWAPVVTCAKQSHSDTIYSSPTLRTSQQHASQIRSWKTQKSLTTICQTYPQPHVEQPVSDEPMPPVPLPSTVYRKTCRNVSRSTTDSSVHTLNSLDPLTEPSLSDDHSIYTTHTSFSSYASSPSYAAEPSFGGAESYRVTIPSEPRTEVSTSTPDDSGVLCMYMPNPKKNPRQLQSLTPALDLMPGASCHEPFVQKPLPPIPASSAQISDNSRRISTVAPLPEPGHIRKTSARYRYEPQDISSRSATPTSPCSRPSSIKSKSSSCTQDLADGGRKRAASYSLFPRTPSTGQQRQLSNGTPSPPPQPPPPSSATPTPLQNSCNLRSPSEPIDGEKEDLTRPPPPPRDPRRHGKVLSTDTEATAVTAEKLHISAAEDEGSPRPSLRLAKTPRQIVLQRQKSMPCLVRPRTPSSGPPPTDPLPALPTVAPSCLPLPLKIPPRKMI